MNGQDTSPTTHNTVSQARSAYTEEDVTGETPLGLISRVYRRAVLEIRRHRVAVRERDWIGKRQSLGKLLGCLSLLQDSLDIEAGGEIAANLDRLYSYMIRRVSEGHLNNDDTPLAEIERHLVDLGEAWSTTAERTQLATTEKAG